MTFAPDAVQQRRMSGIRATPRPSGIALSFFRRPISLPPAAIPIAAAGPTPAIGGRCRRNHPQVPPRFPSHLHLVWSATYHPQRVVTRATNRPNYDLTKAAPFSRISPSIRAIASLPGRCGRQAPAGTKKKSFVGGSCCVLFLHVCVQPCSRRAFRYAFSPHPGRLGPAPGALERPIVCVWRRTGAYPRCMRRRVRLRDNLHHGAGARCARP